MQTGQISADAPPPGAVLWSLTTAYFAPRCLHVLTALGVADAIGREETADAASIAARTGGNALAIERMLRLVAADGVFARRPDGWAHTPLSLLLRADHPQSMAPYVRRLGGDFEWRSAAALTQSARTGGIAAEAIVPGGIWEYFRAHPEEEAIFDQAMAAKSHTEIAALLPVIEARRYGRIADIGGGGGHLLTALLDASPGARGILFDQPEVVARAAPHPRLEKTPGDFFKDPLPAADCYLLSNIIHDWRDPEAVAILKQVRAAAPAHADILVIETLLDDGPGPHVSKVLDIAMLAIGGGQERTEAAYTALFAAAGLRLARVIPTAQPISVLVAKRAD